MATAPVSTTLTALRAANAAWFNAEEKRGAINLGEATRNFYLAVARHAHATSNAPTTFKPDDVIEMRLKTKDGKREDMPKGRTLISRRHDWATVIGAGRTAGPRFAGDTGVTLWNDTAKGVRGFLKVCRELAANPAADDAALASVVKVSDVTAGDHAKRAIDAIAMCDDEKLDDAEGKEFLNAIVDHYAAIVSAFENMRREGKLRTGKELSDAEKNIRPGGSRRPTASSVIASRAGASA